MRPYDLRHSYATTALILGVDQRVVMETMGHSTPTMTMHYQQVVEELKDDAARKMGEALWSD